MICTEEKAKEKWCPMARKAFRAGSFNRTADDIPEGECIASRCMMWQWTENKSNLAIDTGCGYCGLSRPNIK